MPAKVKVSEIAAKVNRLYDLVEERKRLEKEEQVLKLFFKDQAGGVDAVFKSKIDGAYVRVATKERQVLDQHKVAEKLSDKVLKACFSILKYQEVSVGTEAAG